MFFRSTVNEYKDILDKRMLWDIFKIKLKELSSAYCKLRSKSKKTEVGLAIINDRFEQIEKDINSGNNTDKIKTERAEQKKSIIYLKSKKLLCSLQSRVNGQRREILKIFCRFRKFTTIK